MERIAIYGKGGIGKSVIATALSARFAGDGMRVLHVGCDPKHDSSLRLMNNPGLLKTVLEVVGDNPAAVGSGALINHGRLGIHLIEAGGPSPGMGCGGRGVARTLELLEEMGIFEGGHYDAAVFDVLGDVVCGGFAAPLRKGFARKVYIVISEEPMSLYAANNISKAALTYRDNGVRLAGLIVNLRANDADVGPLERFAERLGSRVVAVIRRDPLIMEAETRQQTVVEYAPEADVSRQLASLAREALACDVSTLGPPSPMDDNAFFAFLKG